MSFAVGFATDIGLRRQKNQDAGIALPELGLFVIADGMGGHRGGEIASAMVIEHLPNHITAAKSNAEYTPIRAMTESIQRCNRAIYEKSTHDPELQGMGTTTTALLFEQGRLIIGHVGDSRAYLVKPGQSGENSQIWQLTRDHSFVQEKLRAGLITREQAKNDQTKNVITRSVGFGQETNVEIYEMQVIPGDAFLICSDGLSGMVEDFEMLSVVEKRLFKERNPKAAVDDLIAWANARGGFDNITVALVQVL